MKNLYKKINNRKKILLLYLIGFIIFKSVNYNHINYKHNSPIISIFLPIYNKGRYLFQSIKSIQRQTLKNIEIIAVNDYSNDKSLKILERLAKEDSRIKIINNNKNRGLLYSRAIGIINSSGKYIMNLDPDDELLNNNDLEYLYNIIKKTNVDIITFAYLERNQINLKCSNFYRILMQPELFNSVFNPQNNYFMDFVLWNKIIERNLLRKVYKLFETHIYSNKWNYGEDTIWSLLINKYAKSMICANKTIYLYKTHRDSLMNKRDSYMEINNRIYILNMYKQIFKYKNETKFFCAHILQFIKELNKNEIQSIIKKNFDIKQKLFTTLNSILKNKNCYYDIIQLIQTFISISDYNREENKFNILLNAISNIYH